MPPCLLLMPISTATPPAIRHERKRIVMIRRMQYIAQFDIASPMQSSRLGCAVSQTWLSDLKLTTLIGASPNAQELKSHHNLL